MKHFGHAVVSRPMAAIDEVFREVAAGAVNFGVVPVENSTEGAVSHTLDSFLEHDMVICGEVELRIHHHLLVGENTKTDSITRIYSHAQSLAQCRKWLDAHYPNVERVIILDGFGHSESPEYNAIFAANTPVYDRLRASQPHGLISGSGMDVGLPDGQMGNSEVGHMNLGAGRVVYQDFTRVTKAIRDGEFFHNPVLGGAVDKAAGAGKAVHILGLLSDGGVHSHQDTWSPWPSWPYNVVPRKSTCTPSSTAVTLRRAARSRPSNCLMPPSPSSARGASRA